MLVQSEAKMLTVKTKNKTKKSVDFGFITDYHAFMSVGVQMSSGASAPSVAVLGVGGGSLCMFLRKCFRGLKVTGVELDPVILDVARDYFDLKLDDHLDVQIKDGIDFLRDEAKAGSKYSCVIFDMDNKDSSLGLSCPPKQFLHEEVLNDLKACITDDGQFICNLVCRDNQLHDSILNTIKGHFKHVVTIKLYEEVNEIVLASNTKQYKMEDLETASKELNKTARQRNLVKIKCVDIKDFLQSVIIVS